MLGVTTGALLAIAGATDDAARRVPYGYRAHQTRIGPV